MHHRFTPLLLSLALVGSGTVHAQGPAYDCTAARGIVETLICQDPGLAALDRHMAEVYAAAERKAANEFPSLLKPEQRGWVKGRNECWKSEPRRDCISTAYRLRIAELQARYRLLEPVATASYLCPDKAEVVATYFATDPATLIAERGDSVSLMYQQAAASGARYVGRNESLWEHQGEALIQWGYGAPELSCRKQP
ncbi:MAG TPA: MliC family protein [Roseateles sp.]|nr:MliC family protein [Roseateles sp.]HWT54854.1 MliC family protein [Rhodocyclaceae bacterium]